MDRSTDAPRVGVVVYGDLDGRSGGFLYDRRLADHLAAAGWTVDEVSLPERSYRRSVATNLAPGLVGRLDRCDVVLEDAFCGPSLFLANRRVDAPIVALVHYLRSAVVDGPVRGRSVAAVERDYLRGVDAYVFNSTATRNGVAELVGRDPADLSGVVAPPGGDRFAAPPGRGRSSSPPEADRSASPPEADRLASPPEADRLASPPEADRSAPPKSIIADGRGDRARGVDDGEGGIDGSERPRTGPLRVVAVGNVTPRKGIATLIRGLGGVESEWRLRVVGDTTVAPGHVGSLRALAIRHGVADRVAFTGRVSDAGLREELRAADVLAVPSRYEPFGIVYLEGMGFGLPAVASANGGADDFVDETNGALVPPDDHDAVAAVLGSLARDPDRLARLSRGARETFRTHPTWDETCGRVETFLDDLVAAEYRV